MSEITLGKITRRRTDLLEGTDYKKWFNFYNGETYHERQSRKLKKQLRKLDRIERAVVHGYHQSPTDILLFDLYKIPMEVFYLRSSVFFGIMMVCYIPLDKFEHLNSYFALLSVIACCFVFIRFISVKRSIITRRAVKQ